MTEKSQDDQIYQMRLLGSSPRAIADHFSMSVADVDDALDRTMVKVDNIYRLRAMRVDLERLELMFTRFLGDALSGDLAAGHLCLKIAERKSAMLGIDAPLRVDAVRLTQITAPQPTQREKVEKALERLLRDQRGNGSSEPH